MTRPPWKNLTALPPVISPDKERGARPRVEVRTYATNSKGRLEELTCYPFEYYGSCPNVGDTILDDTPGREPTFYAVQRRYFVQESLIFSGWALILREIDPSGPPQELWNEWRAATKFWEEIDEREEQEEQEAKTERLNALLGKNPRRPPTNSSQTKPKRPKKRKLQSRGSHGRKPKSDG